jgi:hypothetical protein
MANTLELGNGKWATGKDTVLAFNDQNNNFKPLPFSFSRASSATVVNKDGLIETVGSGEPRIDFKDNTKGALLLEPTRSNLVYPSDIGTPTSGFGVKNYLAPDGTISAFKVQPNSTSRRFQVIISGGTYSTNTKLTYSWYRKRVSTPQDTSFEGDLDIKSLINAAQEGDTIQTQSNVSGYDRFSATFNVTNGSLETTLRLYYGNVVGVGNSSIAYWGHQLEVGSYATSYIPTSGSAVTRSADSCDNGGNEQVFNDNEGVLYVEVSALADDRIAEGISISDGTIDNRVVIFKWTATNSIKVRVASGGYNYFDKTVSVSDITAMNKIAIKYKQNDFSLWVNGIELETDTSGITPIGLSKLNINGATSPSAFKGNVKDVRVYNTALTDAELQALTQ